MSWMRRRPLFGGVVCQTVPFLAISTSWAISSSPPATWTGCPRPLACPRLRPTPRPLPRPLLGSFWGSGGTSIWFLAFSSLGSVGADSVSLWSEGSDKWSLSTSELSETSSSESSDCPSEQPWEFPLYYNTPLYLFQPLFQRKKRSLVRNKTIQNRAGIFLVTILCMLQSIVHYLT